MSSTITLIVLGLLGAVLGLAASRLYFRLARAMEQRKTGTSPKTGAQTAEVRQQLEQLDRQLESGLLTKTEYKRKRQDVLQKQ